MKIGPKYKIARRLGAPVFEKTQTQKYAIRLERKGIKRSMKPKSEFAIQLNEKQKARFVYALSERQFSNYIKEALLKKGSSVTQTIYQFLEKRLDNTVYRLGLAKTRLAARQMVTHGHIMVNGKRSSISSRRVKEGDLIEIRKESSTKPLFVDINDRVKEVTLPGWLQLDHAKMQATVTGAPHY